MTVPQTRTSHLLINSNLEGRDNENISYSHQFNWSLNSPKRELIIFSSCLQKWKISSSIDMMKRWKVLVWGLKASIDLMRIWKVLIISPFKIRIDEKMRSSRLRGCHFWKTWWEDEKFSFGGLQASINLMRIWEVLITSPFKIGLDEKMRSSGLEGCHSW